MPPLSAAAVALAFVLDATLREWPERLHPVAWYGSIVGRFDRPWSFPRLVGGLAAVGLPTAAGAGTALLVAIGHRQHPLVGVALAAATLFTTISLRMLLEVARSVIERSETDVASARAELPALVGRDPAGLTAEEVRSAAVESAAENLVDGLVAPLLAFVLLSWSLPLAAGGAVWVKAVNTGDSMLGYRTKPVGWAFARLDDLVMWVPARLCVAIIAVAAVTPGAVVRSRGWVDEVPSPNAGWPMAIVAAVLDVRLEKPGTYVLNPAAALPTPAEARRGVRLVGRAGVLAFAAAGVVAWH